MNFVTFKASTSELYGATKHCPQDEETPFHPRSPYGELFLSLNFPDMDNLLLEKKLSGCDVSDKNNSELFCTSTASSCKFRRSVFDLVYLVTNAVSTRANCLQASLKHHENIHKFHNDLRYFSICLTNLLCSIISLIALLKLTCPLVYTHGNTIMKGYHTECHVTGTFFFSHHKLPRELGQVLFTAKWTDPRSKNNLVRTIVHRHML